MFNRKLKQKIKMLEKELQASKEVHKAHQLIIESYRKDVKELKSKIARKEQPRGSDGRFVKKGSTPFKDGDIIAIDMDNILCKKSVLVGILRGKLEIGNEGFPVYAGLDLNENLEIDETFGCHHEARPAPEKEKEKLFSALKKEGLKWSPETKTLGEIGKKEFKIGDKVRIKEGVSSKTHHTRMPCFLPEMDSHLDKVGAVTDILNGWAIRVDFGSGWMCNHHPDWLEHVE